MSAPDRERDPAKGRAYKTKAAERAAESAQRRARKRRQEDAKREAAYEGTRLTTAEIAVLHRQRKDDFLARNARRAAA